MPANVAIIAKDSADAIIEKYEYREWYISGHSMGGAAAALYMSKNQNKVAGGILLAAYPTKSVGNKKLLLVYGTNDGVLKMNKYNENKMYWNDNTKEAIIEGGNHAQFGYYGKQNKDKEATISTEEQQSRTLNEILDFIK